MSKLALPESISDVWDILTSESRGELMLAAYYKPKSNTIVVWFGNFRALDIPLSWIVATQPTVAVDPNQLSIRGLGQILVLGECEVDVVDILNKFS